MTLSFSVLCNRLTCTSNHHPLTCSVSMPCTMPSTCLHMGASQAVRSRETFREDARLASQGHRDPLLLAEFRSCLSRCSTPPERAGLRPRGIAVTDSAFTTRSFRISSCFPEAVSTLGGAVGCGPYCGRNVGTLESSSAFSYSKMKPDFAEK